MFRHTALRYLVLAALAAGALFQALTAEYFGLEILTEIHILAMLVVALDMVAGSGGMVSLCHGALMGVGAHAYDVLSAKAGIAPPVAMGAAVAVTGAAARPLVLLMDEPTSGIGPEMSGGFHDLLNNLPRDLTMRIIEHDMNLAFDVADTISVLNCGAVVFDGLPDAARGSKLLKDICLGSWEDA